MQKNELSLEEYHHHINQILDKYGNEQSILDVSELDGFVAAVCSSPEEIPISDWMPTVWGGEENTPEWQSEQEINDFVNTFITYYSFTLQKLPENQYTPFFSDVILDKKEDSIADEWCFGYLKGIKLWPKLEKEKSDFLNKKLKSIKLFATDEGKATLDEIDSSEVESIIDNVKRDALEIYSHFRE